MSKRNLFILLIFIVVAVVPVHPQNKGTTVKPAKIEAPKPPRVQTAKPPQTTAKPHETTKPKRDTTNARRAAPNGIKNHQKIQSELVTGKKGRQAEVRFSDSKTRKQMRADILTKSNRILEIKPNTKSGRQKGKSQLRKYEEASRKRGGLIYYEPQTGKYRLERTPYNEWKNRQQKVPAREKPRQTQERRKAIQKPRMRF